jgi:hypothetical protein
MGRYFAPCKICIPHIPVGYAGDRAMQGRKMLLHFLHSLHPCNLAIAGTRRHEEIKLRVFVVNNTAKIYFRILANIAS